MNKLIAILSLAVYVGIPVLIPDSGTPAVLLCAVLAFIAILIINRVGEEREFLLRIFVGGLLVRMAIGTTIFYFRQQEFFGGDSFTYDEYGHLLLRVWQGATYLEPEINRFKEAGGWGMLYIVAAIYGIVGRNTLAVQLVNSVIGAATAP